MQDKNQKFGSQGWQKQEGKWDQGQGKNPGQGKGMPGKGTGQTEQKPGQKREGGHGQNR